MTQINPFTGSILQATQVQRQQAAEKDRHVRRVNDQAKDSALSDDQLEHQVESSEAIAPVHDDQQHPQQKKKSKKRTAGPDESGQQPHVDLTA